MSLILLMHDKYPNFTSIDTLQVPNNQRLIRFSQTCGHTIRGKTCDIVVLEGQIYICTLRMANCYCIIRTNRSACEIAWPIQIHIIIRMENSTC